MSYTKLDAGITDSTVWATPDSTRLTWITMLAMADQHGYVGASIPGLASRARVTLEGCLAALECFKSPDPYSRTKDHEGRRIAEADGGWVLLNHAKYRAKQSEDDRRERSRLAMAKLRASRKQTATDVNGYQPLTTLTQAEAEAEATTKDISTPSVSHPPAKSDGAPQISADSSQAERQKPQKRGSAGTDGFDLFWLAYPNKSAKAAALKAFSKIGPSVELLDDILAAVAMQRTWQPWLNAGGQYIPHAASWLNGRRWEDQPPRSPPSATYETPRQAAAIDRVIEMSGGLLNARRSAHQPETIDADRSNLTALG